MQQIQYLVLVRAQNLEEYKEGSGAMSTRYLQTEWSAIFLAGRRSDVERFKLLPWRWTGNDSPCVEFVPPSMNEVNLKREQCRE
jgi:hypothetical protein